MANSRTTQVTRASHRGLGVALAAWVALAALLSPTAGKADAIDGAAACLQPAELEAWHLRVLQTQLMVAALSCRGARDMGHVGLYNQIVRTHGAELKTAAAHFRRVVTRLTGAQALDRRVTEIANAVSAEALDDPDFCPHAAAFARAIRAAGDAPLAAFISYMPVRLPPPAPLCAGADGLETAND